MTADGAGLLVGPCCCSEATKRKGEVIKGQSRGGSKGHGRTRISSDSAARTWQISNWQKTGEVINRRYRRKAGERASKKARSSRRAHGDYLEGGTSQGLHHPLQAVTASINLLSSIRLLLCVATSCPKP